MVNTFLFAFIPLFVAFDVLGILPIYIKFTLNLDSTTRNKHLRDSLITSFLTALIFVIIGNRVLTYLGISIRDFLIAGGIVIFITAIKDIVSDHTEPMQENEMFGVVPLGIPLLAGPAVLATSAILWNEYEHVYYMISLILNIVICGTVLKFSSLISKILGKRLIEALSKIFSLIIASIAIMFIRKGFQGM
ncbi:MAG TPA: MarC family protein [Syntrophorhabdaceae bacterium]|nr:MarC family protein [Syntrophorhabdaceae bacterium]